MLFFAGAALGSALGGWIFVTHGWIAALMTGAAFHSVALLYWVTEYLSHTRDQRKTA